MSKKLALSGELKPFKLTQFTGGRGGTTDPT